MPSPSSSEATPPVFLVGCGRSGTTLLRMMLNAHPEQAIPQESHFIYHLLRQRVRHRWPADIAQPAHWDRLVTYLAQHPFIGRWDFDPAPLADRLRALPERTYAAAFEAVYHEYTTQQGKTRWGDKTPQHVQYMVPLARLFPQARFIHVVRDGRDVALSLMTRPWGPRHMGLAGYYWAWLVLSGMVYGRMLGPDRYREVTYEDLVLQPEATLRSLSDWLALPYTDAMLDYPNSPAARAYAARGKAWYRKALAQQHPIAVQHGDVTRRLVRPPDKGRVQRWRSQLSASDHEVLVEQAGYLLAYLGYPVEPLPAAQQARLTSLHSLLTPEALTRLDHSAPAHPGTGQRTGYRLLLDRLQQGDALFMGQLERFSRKSLQWQRTADQMLY